MKKKIIKISILLTSLVVLGGYLNKEKYNQNDETLAIFLNEERTESIPSKEEYSFDKAICTVDGTITEEVKVEWDEESWAPILYNVKDHSTKCNLYFKERYQEEILNEADPVLQNDLIPVTIDNDGTVKKADLGRKWYSYTDKEWANAVLLLDNTVYYEPGETIPEEAIESYFVWIPKYRYQLWDLGEYDELTTIDTTKVHEIPIIFGDYNTSDSVEGECTTPMESGATGNCEVGDYMTHPAFLSIPSTGFWVGKFETGYKGATTTEEAQVNEIDSAKVIIKPNAYSWRGIQVANAFYTSYNYQKNLDSHMMKNTEWGAVAYLQHSKYGSALNLRANNNVNFVTGYGNTTDFTCFYTGLNEDCNRVESVLPGVNGNFSKSYATSDGVLANTTGNISGVYDMSGGAWEYVSSLMLSPNNEVLVGNKVGEETGFTGVLSSTGEVTTGLPLPDVKYYDVYLNSSKTMHDYNKRILGDATGEMGPFQESESLTTIKNDSSWYTAKSDFLGIFTHYGITFIRGGTFQKYVSIGKQTGIFGFTSGAGELNLDRSFRLVLTPV